MAILKVKPTTPGQRGLQKVVTEGLHKGKPFAALLEKSLKNLEETIMVGSLSVIVEAAINIILESSILKEISMIFQPKLRE